MLSIWTISVFPNDGSSGLMEQPGMYTNVNFHSVNVYFWMKSTNRWQSMQRISAPQNLNSQLSFQTFASDCSLVLGDFAQRVQFLFEFHQKSCECHCRHLSNETKCIILLFRLSSKDLSFFRIYLSNFRSKKWHWTEYCLCQIYIWIIQWWNIRSKPKIFCFIVSGR